MYQQYISNSNWIKKYNSNSLDKKLIVGKQFNFYY